MRHSFASDNAAGLCPEAREAILAADDGYAASYGDDPWTADAADAIREVFETECDVYFVFNGTAANSLALASLCRSYQSVICHEAAHIETDECGAPEFFSNGSKLLLATGADARLDPTSVRRLATRRDDIHYPQARALSITQSTELGTVYPLARLQELGGLARELGLRVHVDGARFANAVVATGCAPRQLSWEAGVDVLCLGGTKNGLGFGEAVVFFDLDLSREFAYRCKQAGQLASKMRYMAAPWATLLTDGTWLHNAGHANTMARDLAGRLEALGIQTAYPVEANAVFAHFDDADKVALTRDGWVFNDFIGGVVRLMCSWATSERDIEDIVVTLARHRS